MRHLAGFGVHAQETVMGGTGVSPVNGTVRFLHGDLTRSTMMTTSPGSGGGGTGSGGIGSGGIGGGTGVSPVVAYTAFGDPVVWDEGTETWRVGWPAGAGGVGVPPATRYRYKGGWGYESGLITLWGENPDLPPVTLQHVGWRWYQPGIGRFVQRDPIGLGGGLNVYVYCDSRTAAAVDPAGLAASFEWDWRAFWGFVGAGAGAGAVTGAYGGASGGMGVGAIPGGLAGAGIGALAGAAGYTGQQVCVWIYDNVTQESPAPSAPIGGTGGSGGVVIYCVAEGTSIETPFGPVPIEDLVVGSAVLGSRDGALDGAVWGREVQQEWSLVLLIPAHDTTRVIHVQLPSETIVCTSEHPFWVIGHGWVTAGALASGQYLLSIDGEPVPIIDIVPQVLGEPIRVYDLTVKDTHTFFVGRTRVLVHNKKP